MFLNSISAGAGRIILPLPVMALIDPEGDLAAPPAAEAAATAGFAVVCTEAAVLRPERFNNGGV